MTKQTEKTTRTFAGNGMPPIPGLENFNGKFAECCMRASQAYFINAFKLNQEILRFATERMQADIAAMQALSSCKDWSEVASCQSDYTRSAAEAYQAEVSKLTKLSTDATSATLKPLEEAAKTLSHA